MAADQATREELRELFSMDDDEPLADRIEVCSGFWLRSGEVWVFHDDAGDE